MDGPPLIGRGAELGDGRDSALSDSDGDTAIVPGLAGWCRALRCNRGRELCLCRIGVLAASRTRGMVWMPQTGRSLSGLTPLPRQSRSRRQWRRKAIAARSSSRRCLAQGLWFRGLGGWGLECRVRLRVKGSPAFPKSSSPPVPYISHPMLHSPRPPPLAATSSLTQRLPHATGVPCSQETPTLLGPP